MENTEVTDLKQQLERYQELKKTGQVKEVSFLTSTHGYGIENNQAFIIPLLDTMIREIEHQLYLPQSGPAPEILERRREYKAAMELERALNNYGFQHEHFAESLVYMHKTNCQSFFRLVRACILFMANEKNIYIDDRNRASHEMCKELADTARAARLPFI